MATNERSTTFKRKKSRPLKYFYINDDLHKVLRTVRSQDYLEAWNYPESKRVGFVWSDVRRRMEKALTLSQVADLVGRHRVQVENYILLGHIPAPQRMYSLDGSRKIGKYMFSEKDALGLHDYLMTIHIGRPRKDGRITPGKGLPSRAELKAMIREDVETYVKTPDGRFVRTYREHTW